jgi:hypothetical protein
VEAQVRLDLTLVQLNAVRLHLADQFEDDEKGWLDLIEGETDAFEMVRKLLDGIEADEGDKAALKSQIDDRKVRQTRCDARIDARREALIAILECAGLDKLTLAEATLSVRQLAAAIKVNDPTAVPEEYTVNKPAPDLEKIKADFTPDSDALPNWLRVEPARPSLTIRRK